MKYQNILLIDDDEEDQEIFLYALGQVSNSVNCKTLTDASLALEKLSAKEIEPEVIFLDLNMPKMNGQQFLVEAKKREGLKNIPIIIFSTTSHPATIQLTKELGASDFITKPGSFDDLVSILHRYIVK